MPRRPKTIEMPPGRLWPNFSSGAPCEIEVFGATGELESGKTLLGLSLAPGVFPEGHEFAGKERTLNLDMEKSSGTYAGAECRRIDVPARLTQQFPSGYQPIQLYQWFVKSLVPEIPNGRFDVIMVDPVADLEAGITDYVKSHPDQFGYTQNQFDKSGGLLWGAVKTAWKAVLLQVAVKCQIFFFTSHLRNEWQGNRPTGRREPRGKETLAELASLYLWMERLPDAQGNVPAIPSANVLKQRLANTSVDEETGELKIERLLPPRLPQATVGAIRGYIAYPVNQDRLGSDERLRTAALSDDERLRLETTKAEAESQSAQGELALLQERARLQALARGMPTSVAPAAETATTTPAATAQPAAETPAADQPKRLSQSQQFLSEALGGPTTYQAAIIRVLQEQIGLTDKQFNDKIAVKYDGRSLDQLTAREAGPLIAAMEKTVADQAKPENQTDIPY